ncbi:MAG: phosphatase PAP2 family protein [Cytophagaceae bacterium]
MLEFIKELDLAILLWVNSLHTPLWDSVMIFFTERFTWLPLYFVLVVLIIRREKLNSWLIFIFITLLIIFSDQLASGIMKPLVGRLRPCHDEAVQDLLYLAAGCGGKYGFFSSHAANSFAALVFLSCYFRSRWCLILLIWAVGVSLSRVYLGVHYPLDIIMGAVSGVLIGYVMIHFYNKTKAMLQKKSLLYKKTEIH